MRSNQLFARSMNLKQHDLVEEERVMAGKLDTINKVTTRQRPRIRTSLLELIRSLNSVTDNDRLVVATATHLVNFGDTRLTGSFKNGRVVIE